MPNCLSAGADRSFWLYEICAAVSLTIVASGPRVGCGAGVPPPALPDQQSGNGVALGSGLKAGSRQPLNVRTLPSGPRTGSVSDGTAFSVPWVLGAGREGV